MSTPGRLPRGSRRPAAEGRARAVRVRGGVDAARASRSRLPPQVHHSLHDLHDRIVGGSRQRSRGSRAILAARCRGGCRRLRERARYRAPSAHSPAAPLPQSADPVHFLKFDWWPPSQGLVHLYPLIGVGGDCDRHESLCSGARDDVRALRGARCCSGSCAGSRRSRRRHLRQLRPPSPARRRAHAAGRRRSRSARSSIGFARSSRRFAMPTARGSPRSRRSLAAPPRDGRLPRPATVPAAGEPAAAAAGPHRPPWTCRQGQPAPEGLKARCRSTAMPPRSSKVFNPDMAVIGNFLGAVGENSDRVGAVARDARGGGDVPGGRRSVCPRRRVPGRVPGGARDRGRISHADEPAGWTAGEGRQDEGSSSARSTPCTRTRCRGWTCRS